MTTLIAAGVDARTVAERHGHARATMTLDRYVHASSWSATARRPEYLGRRSASDPRRDIRVAVVEIVCVDSGYDADCAATSFTVVKISAIDHNNVLLTIARARAMAGRPSRLQGATVKVALQLR